MLWGAVAVLGLVTVLPLDKLPLPGDIQLGFSVKSEGIAIMVERKRLSKPASSKSEVVLRNGNRRNKAGRPKGSPNRTPRILKDAILEAAAHVGEDGKGTRQLMGYCIKLAREYPRSFTTLLSRVLPYQITGKNDGPIQVFHFDPSILAGATPEELQVLERLLSGQRSREPEPIDVDSSEYEELLTGD